MDCWLKGSGFDVSHGHTDPSLTQGNEVVEFRLMNWKAVHGKGGDQDKQLIDTLKKIGCEVVVSEHSGHSDIKFRAPVCGMSISQNIRKRINSLHGSSKPVSK